MTADAPDGGTPAAAAPDARATGEGWLAPPRPLNAAGEVRRIGVELEYAGVSVERAAEELRAAFGGEIRFETPHRAHVEGAEFGPFRVELDMNLAHRRIESQAGRSLRDAALDVSAAVVPMEIVFPPTPWDRAHAYEAVCARLRARGAEGTGASLFYAFGLQLNPELASRDVGHVLAVLRAFLLLRDWLRDEIRVDPSRRIWLFERPFPNEYAATALAPDYAPDWSRFVDDYLASNATRDRELDLLPMIADRDPDIVRGALPKEKVNPRPTWHYRLPNSAVDDPDWSMGLEWARWVRVERLAERPDMLASAAATWLENRARLIPADWTPESRRLAEAL